MTSSSEEFPYQTHVEKAPIGIFEVNQGGEYVEVNEAACELLGYSEDELLEMSILDLHPGHDDPKNVPGFVELIETGHIRIEIQLTHKDGHAIDVILEAVELEEGRFVAYVQDISEQKESEKALERTRDELRQIIDLIPDPIFVKNRDDEILLTNEANAELLGATPEEVEGKPEPEFFPDSDHYETLRQRDIEIIESGEPTMFEEEVSSLESGKHIFLTSRIPFKTSNTGEEAVLGYARDVTELKKYEKKLEEQRDNLETLNQVLRHDVRNDLQLVSAYADLLVEKCEDENLKKYITTIQNSADQAIEFTETAREMSEVMLSDPQEGQQVNLRTAIDNEVSEVQSSYPEAVVTYDTKIPSVVINATDMISSVFRNLLKNAIQHNDKAVAEITVSATERDDIVVIRIADNGPGIPDAQKTALFGKGEQGLESEGSGMGLYLVNSLVTSYGGEVWIEDNDPEGSIFVVELPKAS